MNEWIDVGRNNKGNVDANTKISDVFEAAADFADVRTLGNVSFLLSTLLQ